MPVYLFQLGHQPLLSQAEIRAVLKQRNITVTAEKLDTSLLEITTDQPLAITELNNQLGGTVKIMEALPDIKKIETDGPDYLNKIIPDGKINFSLSGPNNGKIAIGIKKELKARGRSVRYIEIKNTATILHNNLVDTATDLTIYKNQVFVTRAIQEIEAFVERDYGRPGADSRSGMLPPKLARLLINLSGVPTTTTILDPFCGSGTVLMEAADLGFTNLIGADNASRAITDTKKNLVWIAEKKYLNLEPKIIQSDARALIDRLKPNSVDAIVSEPYMGTPLRGKETKEELLRAARELATLYESSLSVFGALLRANGVAIFIIPEFYAGKEIISVDCLKNIRKFGLKISPFSPEHPSLLYKRSNQHLGRRIWKFEKV